MTFFGKIFAPFELLKQDFTSVDKLKYFKRRDLLYTNNKVFPQMFNSISKVYFF